MTYKEFIGNKGNVFKEFYITKVFMESKHVDLTLGITDIARYFTKKKDVEDKFDDDDFDIDDLELITEIDEIEK